MCENKWHFTFRGGYYTCVKTFFLRGFTNAKKKKKKKKKNKKIWNDL